MNFTPTYPGWEEDKGQYLKYTFVSKSTYNQEIAGKIIEKIKRKQQLHEGDRSHSEIKRIDDLNCTYRGWEIDRNKYEKNFCENISDLNVKGIYKSMKRKQALHLGDRSDPLLRKFDELKFIYPGRNSDIKEFQRIYESGCNSAKVHLEMMQDKQW
eukprot:CAMPEP_0194293076 /NCGR_PEP_ID=MMETSP0169-20130528/47070_1 /TAXON_ID=218684 /ORGANISM="Corethron pennatum, Strain L29A3" /LENGTH=155 /DNA_ID=CAMNT_0039041455 /DNA_START=83 /DNA_END=547 /DNA_ORIENTATION=+